MNTKEINENISDYIIEGGVPVAVTAAPAYSTYDSKVPASYYTGEYYIYDDKIRYDRVRLCDSKSKVGMPCTRLGWFNITDLIFNPEKDDT